MRTRLLLTLAASAALLVAGFTPSAWAQKTPASQSANTPAAPAGADNGDGSGGDDSGGGGDDKGGGNAGAGAGGDGAGGGNAAAPGQVDAKDPAALAAILKGFGIARIESNSNSGNPQIDGRADGKSYKLFFYGCTEKVNCKSVQFWAYWDQEVGIDKLNEWNKNTRYGKVYLDDDKDVILEYDVNLIYGVADRTFEDNADIWVTLLGRVEKEVLGN